MKFNGEFLTRGRRRRVRAVSAFIAGGSLLAALTACSSGDGSAAKGSSEPYKIGSILALSGSLAFAGTPQLNGLKAAIDAQNKAGGVNGRQIDIIPEDASDAATAVTALRGLSEQGALGYFGPNTSDVQEALAPAQTQLKIASIGPSGTANLLDPANPYVFSTAETSTSQAQPMAQFASATLGGTGTIALAPLNTPASADWAAQISNKWAALDGLKVSSSVPLPLTSADLTPQIEKLVAGHPGAVLTEVLDSGALSLIQGLRKAGFTGPVLASTSTGTKVLTTLNDPNVYAFQTTIPASDGKASGAPAGATAYANALTAHSLYDEAIQTAFVGRGYTAGLALIAALQICGADCTNSEAFAKSLAQVDLDTKGLTGSDISFTTRDHQGVDAGWFYHFVNGVTVKASDTAYSYTTKRD